MVNTEFWYAEVGSRAEGRSRSAGQSMRWWLPSPRVPTVGLSEIERKRLLHQGKLIYQVFKAAKSINENVLAEMPIPTTIRDALPKVRTCIHCSVMTLYFDTTNVSRDAKLVTYLCRLCLSPERQASGRNYTRF